jgi:NHLM bacteriocin system ABC transporter ATP-binding protein
LKAPTPNCYTQVDMAVTSLGLQLEKLGKLQTFTPNVPFSVEDANSVWIVRSGKLDLFVVATRNGSLYGARQHVLRVQEGHAVFGVGAHFVDAAFVASAAPGTDVLLFSLDQFFDLPGSGHEEHDSPVWLIEDWICSLGQALSGDVVRGAFLTLETGQVVSLPEEPKAVVPREGVVWVAHRKGSSRFLGEQDLPAIGNNGYFPVSRHGWLQAAPGSELCPVATTALWDLEDRSSSLHEFHAIAMSYLRNCGQKKAEKEQSLLHARKASDTSLLQSALLRLSSPILKVRELRESEDTCRHPVFMACEAIGKKLNIKIKPHPDMVRGIDPPDPLASIARASGIRMRTVALKGEWWSRENGPLLAFREQDNQPVALLPRSSHSYECYEPVGNVTVAVDRELAATLKPFGCVLYRSFPIRAMGALDLLRFGFFGCKRELMTIVLMGIAAGIMGMIPPYATGVIFDQLIPGSERGELVAMAIFLVVIAMSTALFTFARSFAVLRLEGKLDASIQAAVWDRLLSLPVSFFRDYSSGDLAQRSLGIAAIRQTLTGPTLTAILSGIFSVFSFALLFYYSWKMALLATGLVLCACAVSVVCGVIQVQRQRQISLQDGTISSLLLQFVTGIAKFRISGTERRAFAVWAREFAKLQQISIKARLVTNGLTVFNSTFPLAALALIFAYHQRLMAASSGASQITTGDFVAFLAAFTQFLMAALLLSSALIAALSVVPLYERAQPIFHSLPEVTDVKATPGKLSGMVEISRVTFRYKPDTPLVLRDVSIKILPGQFVAIAGASGSGKSTLFRMLLGFETPESGAIYFDGQDLSGLDVQAVRRQIGVVLQSSRPISGSIFDNIVGSAPLSVEDAWEAARLAGIAADIEKMPMGMHTHLSDGGGGISGGQRQRLMIARAIVGRPRILLFDEATSALDNHTQAVVSRSLESLQATRIVIAHRLSTIIRADNIFVMDKGAVVDNGTYEELISREEIFRDLAKRQMT